MKEFHSSALLAKQPQPIEWVVDGILPLLTLGDVSGPPGDGKSTILLSLCASVSAGCEWFSHNVRQMPVAWVSGEASGEAALCRDLWRLRVTEDADILFLMPDEAMFRFDRLAGQWNTTPEGAAIFQRCKDAGIGLIVIDTIGSVTAGLQEIDNDQQRQLARHIRKETLGMTSLLVSHTNQASAKDSLDWRLHYLSRAGGNGFPGAVRWAAGVSKLQAQDAERLGGRVTTDEIESSKLVAFGVSKHNEMPRPAGASNDAPLIFEIRPDGELVLVASGEAIALHRRNTKSVPKSMMTAKKKEVRIYAKDDF